MDNFYTAKELKEKLHIGINEARKLMKTEGFPSIRLNKRYIVSSEALKEWADMYKGKEFTF